MFASLLYKRCHTTKRGIQLVPEHSTAEGAQDRRYYIQNKDKFRESQRRYYLKKQALLKEKQRLYRLENKDAIKERQKLYHHNHKEAVRERRQRYRINNKEAILGQYKRYWGEHRAAINERQRKYRQDRKEEINEKAKIYYRASCPPRKNKNWKDLEEVRLFLESVRKQLLISKPEDWYRISRGQLMQLGGKGLFASFGSMSKALKSAYPEFDWEESKFSFRGKKSEQRWLRVTLSGVIPTDTKIVEDFLHPDLSWEGDKQISTPRYG